MSTEQTHPPAIWAVGGGKGGTGKSFLAANLAVAVGAGDGRIVLIDADLGGPNLHTLLAVRDGDWDLGDFIKNRVSRLQDIAIPTPYPGLNLIRGGENALFLANLSHGKKLKLIRQIKSLPAERVIIDLGTGSAYNTLDLFVIAEPGIMVMTPETTAVENTYLFLKSCAVRILKLYAHHFGIQGFAEAVGDILEHPGGTVRGLIERLAVADRSSGQILTAALRSFKPRLVVNKVRGEKDVLLGRSIVDVVRKFFLVDLDLLGTIPYDERVDLSLRKFCPFLLEYPESGVSRAIRKMAERLTSPCELPGGKENPTSRA
ncbi:MAG: P-loop NTPase [Acidobacteriota bacterium]